MGIKIAIVMPSWVGDCVMAHPLITLLTQQYPGAKITALAMPGLVALIERMPGVDAVLPIELGHGDFKFFKRRAYGKQWAGKWDWVIVLPNSWKSALIPFFTNAPKRTGWRGEMRYGLLTDHRILEKAKYPLLVSRYAALAFAPGATLPTLPAPQLRPKTVIPVEGKVLALCPGAEYGPSKRWPVDYWTQVAKAYDQKGWQVWILGSAKEKNIAQTIQAAVPAVKDLTGTTSLAGAVDYLAAVTAVVSNDSGLMHIAAAVGKPIVAVYGSTDPGYTPPLSDKAMILRVGLSCSPCFKRECPLGHYRCLQDLMPDRVITALAELGV